MKYIVITLSLMLISACSEDDIYKDKSEQQKYLMYHDARVKKVMQWTCNLLIEEAYNYQQAKKTKIDSNELYFHEYPYHFDTAKNVYRSVIETSLKGHPYKLPNTELDISYIQPFKLEQLTCKDKLTEWQKLKNEWNLSK